MRGNPITRGHHPGLARMALLLAWAGLSTLAGTAGAELRYTRGSGTVPNPAVYSESTTFVLYGIYPTRCGFVEQATVLDTGHVAVRIRSTHDCPPDSVIDLWAASFPLGLLAAGEHTVSVELTMDHADSGVTVQTGPFTFNVEHPGSPPPPPPPPPPSDGPLLSSVTTEPNPPTPDVPVTLVLGGYAPFHCPQVTSAAIVDTSRLALTLFPSAGCPDTSSFWTYRFDLGLQREGHHDMDLALTVGGDSVVTHHLPVHFLVVNPSGWPPAPPDTIPHVLSPSRPNPFSVESRFSVTLEDGVAADVSVFDLFGRRVRTVFRGRFASGTTELAWNGRRDDGSRAAAGIYFYRLTLPGRVFSTHLVLLPQP